MLIGMSLNISLLKKNTRNCKIDNTNAASNDVKIDFFILFTT